MATTPRSEDLIADARDWARDMRALFPLDGTAWDDVLLVERLADALEGKLRNTEQDRDELRAVIEKAREWRDEAYHGEFGADDYAQGYQMARRALLRILSSVPADVLRERDADRWDEGFAAGVNHDMGDWEVPPEPIDNPYRHTEEEK